MKEICCPKCHGKGAIPLPAHLAETLALLNELGPVTAAELQGATYTSRRLMVTAMNNRLVALEQLGLARRVSKDGKVFIWDTADTNRQNG